MDSDSGEGIAGRGRRKGWVLSVGATPTAHAVEVGEMDGVTDGRMKGGIVELHAGVYVRPCCAKISLLAYHSHWR